jgi:hypothetical protein
MDSTMIQQECTGVGALPAMARAMNGELDFVS